MLIGRDIRLTFDQGVSCDDPSSGTSTLKAWALFTTWQGRVQAAEAIDFSMPMKVFAVEILASGA